MNGMKWVGFLLMAAVMMGCGGESITPGTLLDEGTSESVVPGVSNNPTGSEAATGENGDESASSTNPNWGYGGWGEGTEESGSGGSGGTGGGGNREAVVTPEAEVDSAAHTATMIPPARKKHLTAPRPMCVWGASKMPSADKGNLYLQCVSALTCSPGDTTCSGTTLLTCAESG